MKKIVGLIKIHYMDMQNHEAKDTITSRVYDLKEFKKAVSLYKFLMDNEIECDFNEVSTVVPEEWGNMNTVFVDDIFVTLGNDVDLWVLDVYVK